MNYHSNHVWTDIGRPCIAEHKHSDKVSLVNFDYDGAGYRLDFATKDIPIVEKLLNALQIAALNAKQADENGQSFEKHSEMLADAIANATTCCKEWGKAHEDTTDNEAYGALVRYSYGSTNTGSDIPPVRFCPWCGVPKAEEEANAS